MDPAKTWTVVIGLVGVVGALLGVALAMAALACVLVEPRSPRAGLSLGIAGWLSSAASLSAWLWFGPESATHPLFLLAAAGLGASSWAVVKGVRMRGWTGRTHSNLPLDQHHEGEVDS